MRVPDGYTAPPSHVLRLRKSLYGLKQAPLCWYNEAVTLFESLGYKTGISDKCIFYKVCIMVNDDGLEEHHILILSIYVDDLLAWYPPLLKDQWYADKKSIINRFQIKDLGTVSWILNMRVTRDRANRTITLSQQVYVDKVLERFGMTDCKIVATPSGQTKPTEAELKGDYVLDAKDKNYYQQMVGSLMYASTTTRVDISYAVQQLSQAMSSPHAYHITRAKRVMRYLKGTRLLSLVFGGVAAKARPVLYGYSDSDWAGDCDCKSISGNLLFCMGSLIGWMSRKQSTISQSSCEAEYAALASLCNNTQWARNVLQEVFGLDIESIPLFTDSKAAIGLAGNQGVSARTKHVAVRMHVVREMVKSNVVKLVYVPTEQNLADVLTKSLSVDLFKFFASSLLVETAEDDSKIASVRYTGPGAHVSK